MEDALRSLAYTRTARLVDSENPDYLTVLRVEVKEHLVPLRGKHPVTISQLHRGRQVSASCQEFDFSSLALQEFYRRVGEMVMDGYVLLPGKED